MDNRSLSTPSIVYLYFFLSSFCICIVHILSLYLWLIAVWSGLVWSVWWTKMLFNFIHFLFLYCSYFVFVFVTHCSLACLMAKSASQLQSFCICICRIFSFLFVFFVFWLCICDSLQSGLVWSVWWPKVLLNFIHFVFLYCLYHFVFVFIVFALCICSILALYCDSLQSGLVWSVWWLQPVCLAGKMWALRLHLSSHHQHYHHHRHSSERHHQICGHFVLLTTIIVTIAAISTSSSPLAALST